MAAKRRVKKIIDVSKFNKLEATGNAETALAGKVLQNMKTPTQHRFSGAERLNTHDFQSPQLPPGSKRCDSPWGSSES